MRTYARLPTQGSIIYGRKYLWWSFLLRIHASGSRLVYSACSRRCSCQYSFLTRNWNNRTANVEIRTCVCAIGGLLWLLISLEDSSSAQSMIYPRVGHIRRSSCPSQLFANYPTTCGYSFLFYHHRVFYQSLCPSTLNLCCRLPFPYSVCCYFWIYMSILVAENERLSRNYIVEFDSDHVDELEGEVRKLRADII